jgi:LGFP repeat
MVFKGFKYYLFFSIYKNYKMKKTICLNLILILFFNSFLIAQTNEKLSFEIQATAISPFLSMGAFNTAQPNAIATPALKGFYLSYAKGNLYFNTLRKTISRLQIGDILNKWKAENYDNGILGMVAGSEAGTANGKGSYAYFENGAIYWTHNKGAFTITGAFMEYYKNVGLEESKELGFPKTDAIKMNNKSYSLYQQFELGTLFYNTKTNSVVYINNPDATSIK